MNQKTIDPESLATGRSLELLRAVDAAAAALQRSPRSLSQVLAIFRNQVADLGLRGGLGLLEEDGETLTIRAAARHRENSSSKERLGSQFSSSNEGYSVAVSDVSVYRDVIEGRRAIFVPDSSIVLGEVLPKGSQSTVNAIRRLVGGEPAIFAPIITEGQVIGIVNVAGENLVPEDALAFQAFAHQMALALDNAKLHADLRASEDNYGILVEQASEGIFISLDLGVILEANASACAMLGYTQEELTGTLLSDLVADIDAAYSLPRFDTLRPGESLIAEGALLCKDGSKLSAEISMIRLSDGRLQSIFRDVSERTRSERALQRHADRLAAIRELDQAIFSARSPREIATVGLERLQRLMPFQRATISLLDFERGEGSILAIRDGEEIEEDIDRHFALRHAGSNIESLKKGEIHIARGELHGSHEAGVKGENVNSPSFNVLNIPLVTHSEVIGSLSIGKAADASFLNEEVDIAREVAALLALAIQDSRFLENERRRRQEAETLISVTSAITSTLEMDQVLGSILLHLEQVVPYNSARIFLLEDDGLRAVAGRGLPELDQQIGREYSADHDLVQSVLATSEPLILEDAQASTHFREWLAADQVRGWMGVPLIVRQELIGFLSLGNKSVAAYGGPEATLAQAFANQVAVTIENARLFAESRRLLGHSRQQADQLQQIVDIVPDGIILLDAEGRIILASQAAENYLAQLTDARVGDVLTHLHKKTIDELLQPTPSASPWQDIVTLEPQRVFEVSVRPLVEEGPDAGWLLIIRNVTEEREHERYLSAQERLATVGQLAAGIAHDFNNIMAVITLYTQLVLKMPDLPIDQERRLNTIYQQAQRAAELIKQILDFSRRSVIERKPLDLLPYVKELSKLLQRTLPETIRLSVTNDPGEYLIEADPTRLQQMIMNLAVNARDAMAGGGSLTLDLSPLTLRPGQPVPLPDMTAGRWIRLNVSDGGSGISRENLSHIFEPFFTTKPTGKGTGLGLAQVYGIVKQHDGFINVESQVGEGTTFSIYLPTFSPLGDAEEASEVGAPTSGRGETVLVVEDDQAAREALAELVEMLNYEVISAANGEEALAIYQEYEGKVDLVVSDMVMPVMGGATLYKRLKELQPDIRMIVVTGYPLRGGTGRLIDQGIAAYIHKPIQVEEIAEAMRVALARGP